MDWRSAIFDCATGRGGARGGLSRLEKRPVSDETTGGKGEENIQSNATGPSGFVFPPRFLPVTLGEIKAAGQSAISRASLLEEVESCIALANQCVG